MGRWFWQRPEHHVERATSDDLAVLAEIHEASFPHGWDADTLARLIGSPGMACWVARATGGPREPLGFVLVRSSGEEAEIITIATARHARRRGVAGALMRHAIRELQRDRVVRLFLEVSEHNAAALSLYRLLGFRQVGQRKGYYASHTRSPTDAPPAALVMELVLR